MDIDNVEGQMLILQSKSTYSRLLELNSVNGIYREAKRVAIDGGGIKINGVFDFLNGVLVVLYAITGRLFLRIGNQVISLDEECDILVSGDRANRVLRVNKNGNEVASLIYSVSDAPVFFNDLTAFVENEDFDFGLFVANVVSSQDRRNVVLKNW